MFNKFADSDFVFYYDETWLRIVTFHGVKSNDYDICKKWETELII